MPPRLQVLLRKVAVLALNKNDMKPKTLITINYIKDGVCQAELDLTEKTDAKRLGAALFQLSRKNPLVIDAIFTAIKLMSMDPALAQIAEQLAEKEAIKKLSNTPKN